MKHKSYLIETMPAGNTDIDHVKDVCCTVCRNGIEVGRFTVTQNELGEYDSLEKAVKAYMQRDYPDNAWRTEANYRKIQKAETRLQKRQRALLTDILRRNGGRVTSYPVPDEDGGVEYPVTMTCSGNTTIRTSALPTCIWISMASYTLTVSTNRREPPNVIIRFVRSSTRGRSLSSASHSVFANALRCRSFSPD